ncbi:pyruvate kinase [Methylobacterium brachythecii]|uniref:Pyruvate kinase n=1 Tax=Methylobacterium brachythecii TaxID=1176177 RepID=A0A7W6F5I5_9HYPH|nr:pyruvate kinase [Methylobacterium brachythecii]MBB3901387.1 pyruvate kinase [Methylobacterium brachythecii]GLS42962.1 pyruvate kinase [Methylobacterium brachythecii]
MRRHRHAKIVATVGPATNSPEMLRNLFLAGVDTFRLNFSHGVQEDHARVHAAIRTLEKEVGRPIGILQDLQGPKIRVGTVAGGRLDLVAGETIRFVLDGADGDKNAIPLRHPEIFAAVVPGQDLLIDDGRVRVRVTGLEAATITAEVVTGGAISNRKGVNLPGTLLDLSPLTEKDRADLAFGLELGVDWVALSFVQRPSDLIEARGIIGDRAGIMSKIEKPQALERIEDIIRLSDAVMVARGDLGVEIPHEDVPGRQKELIRACRLAVKPVIVATQMLDSMVGSPAPTRAEASDVATAIYDGADAVMLSAESATGRYPVEAVGMMDRIIRSVEGHKLYHSLIAASEPGEEETPPHAVATATADLAEAVKAAAIVAYTASGTTAARVARKRPKAPILALTPNLATSRRLSLLWGAHSVLTRDVESYEEMTANAAHHARTEGFAEPNDIIVTTAGIPFHTTGNTNNIRLIQV